MKEGTYDERVAARYDREWADMFDPTVLEPTVEFLAELAGEGRALEFAIGTGRVGLTLSARGVQVVGIEISTPMANQMRSKPGADQVPVTIGDVTTTRVEGSFRLVYLAYNTIMNLLTQDEQVACFGNASAHLEPGGYFVIEAMIPALRRLPPGETVVPFDLSPGHVCVDEYDVVNQRLVAYHFWSQDGHDDGRDSALRWAYRYAWPAEFDLMARMAGMKLHQRWRTWNRAPFTSESTTHVSVWQKA